jgi:hypothetical protein
VFFSWDVKETSFFPVLCCLKADTLFTRFLCAGNPEVLGLKVGADGGLAGDDVRSMMSLTKAEDSGARASSDAGFGAAFSWSVSADSIFPESRSKYTRSPRANAIFYCFSLELLFLLRRQGGRVPHAGR